MGLRRWGWAQLGAIDFHKLNASEALTIWEWPETSRTSGLASTERATATDSEASALCNQWASSRFHVRIAVYLDSLSYSTEQNLALPQKYPETMPTDNPRPGR
jgi:hypothetical protein